MSIVLVNIACTYRYHWIARHRGAIWFVIGILFGFVIAETFSLMRGDGITLKRPSVLFLLILFGFISGYLLDIFFGVIRKDDKVVINDDGISIRAKKSEENLPWSLVHTVDEFDIHDTYKESHGGNTDYWQAMGVGGLRLISADKRIWRVYSSIENYKELRSQIINKSFNAVRLKNSLREKIGRV